MKEPVPATIGLGHCPTPARGWEKVPLGSVVTFLDHLRRPVTASNRVAGKYPYYGANGQQGFIDGFIFDEELVLLAEDGGYFGDPTRKIAYRIQGKSWVNNHAHVLRPGPIVAADYLCRVLENYDVSAFVTGSTRAKLNKGMAAQIPIPLPPLPEQRRIAAILDAADALRAKRRATIAALDTLTQSIFLDMFGDPFSNPMGWSELQMGAISVKFSDGPFGSNLKTSDYAERGVRVIRLQNIGTGRFIDDDRAFISESHFAKLQKHLCRPGDVLVGTLGDPNLRACLQPDWLGQAINKADCVQIRVDVERATAPWLVGLINSPGTLARAQSRIQGQTRLRVSMGRLRELLVPVPPLRLQEQFGLSVARVEGTGKAARHSLGQLDLLFASLQSRAFRGEL